MAEPLSPHHHRHLGRYELVQRIDVGGMAEIFLAVERAALGFERLVVIKRALPHLAETPAFREMFLQEARFIARITHPNIVQIHELGELDGTAYIAMEYVLGTSFRDLVVKALHAERVFPVGVCIGLMAQACAGAHAAHELVDPQGKPLGLVHRDISPHNLMVTLGGHVKLLDFGIAKATELGVDTTRSGALKGKLHYMSPEQLQQERLDRRSDVFALGIVAWELLTLKRLFKRSSDMATMKVIIEGGQWDAREFRPEVPQGVAEAVMRALAPAPDKRFATADAFRRALEQAADAAGLRHGTDEVAAIVDELAGDSLRANEAAVTAAVERARTQGYDDADLADTEEPGAPTRSPTDTMPRAWTGSRPMVATRLPLPRSTWRWAVAVFLLAMAVGAGGAWLLSRQPALQGPAHRVGWPPTIDAAVLAVDVEPLREHLERATGRPVEFIYSPSYGELADQLLDGGVAFASLPPALLVRTERRDSRVQALALKLIGGSSGTDGVLLSVEGSGVATLLDLKGKRVCVPDDQSTTGLLLPRYAARRAGVDWEKEVTVVHSGNHLQVLRDLAARKCEAGGTYQGAFVNAVTQGVDVSMLRQIAITGRSPQDTLVAGPAASRKDIEAFQAALFSFVPQTGRPGESLGTIERITGFAPVKPEDFTALREMMDAEGAPGPP